MDFLGGLAGTLFGSLLGDPAEAEDPVVEAVSGGWFVRYARKARASEIEAAIMVAIMAAEESD